MKNTLHLFLFLLLSASLVKCAGNSGLQEKAPIQLKHVFYQVRGDSMYLQVPLGREEATHILLDSIYFRERRTALKKEQPGMYVAQFFAKKKNLILSEDPYQEYSNELPGKPLELPFDIKKDEAIVVYRERQKTRYYKIKAIQGVAED